MARGPELPGEVPQLYKRCPAALRP